MTEGLSIIKPSLATSIQDAGRRGTAQWGIPGSGAMDMFSMRLANALVGNPTDAALIEFTVTNALLEFHQSATIACCGAVLHLLINDQPYAVNGPHRIKAGDRVELLTNPKANYYYLAIAGKLKCKYDFNSASTYPLASLGGLNGGLLTKDSRLYWEEFTEDKSKKIKLSTQLIPSYAETTPIIRMLKGTEFEWIQAGAKVDLEKLVLYVTNDINRMGYRVKAEGFNSNQYQIISSVTLPGTIQLTAAGQCIILMRDAQTTGGYPRIGKVIDADINRLAQLKPAQAFKLRVVDLAEANRANEYFNELFL